MQRIVSEHRSSSPTSQYLFGGVEDLSGPLGGLFDFMSSLKWDDGTDRLPGTVLLFAEGGRLKACVVDKDGDLCAFRTLGGLSTALQELSEALAARSLDWRPNKRPGRK